MPDARKLLTIGLLAIVAQFLFTCFAVKVPDISRRQPRNLDVMVYKMADKKYYFVSKDELSTEALFSKDFNDKYYTLGIVIINGGESYVLQPVCGEHEGFVCEDAEAKIPTRSQIMAIDSQKEDVAALLRWMHESNTREQASEKIVLPPFLPTAGFFNTWVKEPMLQGPQGKKLAVSYGFYLRDDQPFETRLAAQSPYQLCYVCLALPWEFFAKDDPTFVIPH